VNVAYINQPLDAILPPHQNSIGIWTYRVAPLVGESMNVRVYGRRTAQQRNWNQQKNVEYEFYPIIPHKILGRLSRLHVLAGGGKLPAYASQSYYVEYILMVARNVRTWNSEVVHIHNFTQFVPIVRKLNPQARIVLHMNCEWLTQLDYSMMDERISQADLVLGSSNYITELVKHRFPHHRQRCQTIYNGVDTNLFKPQVKAGNNGKRNGHRILFVGRVSPEKGVHDLIQAFLQVLNTYPDAKLDIVGPIGAMPKEFLVGVSEDSDVARLSDLYQADYYSTLTGLIPAEFAHSIQFHGGVPQAELVSFYNAADVIVNPSYSESFGMSLIEAMACEKPVVATRVGGMVEILQDQEVGILVERGDIQALAESMVELLAAQEYRERLGKKGRRRVMEFFSWPQVASQVVRYYKNLL
jgi:glycosyltransferase involved in cell wall biosynthesis